MNDQTPAPETQDAQVPPTPVPEIQTDQPVTLEPGKPPVDGVAQEAREQLATQAEQHQAASTTPESDDREQTTDDSARSDETDDQPKRRNARERIDQLTAEKRQLEARSIMAEKDAQQLREQLQQLQNIQHDETKSFDEQEMARLQQVVKAERLQEKEAEAQRSADQAYQQTVDTFWAQVDNARDRMPDFNEVIANTDITAFGVEAMASSPKGAEIGYWLGKNKLEASRIAALPPHMQGAEIARIEARVSAAPTARKVSNAPPPTPALTGAAVQNVKDPADMSMTEYVKYRGGGG